MPKSVTPETETWLTRVFTGAVPLAFYYFFGQLINSATDDTDRLAERIFVVTVSAGFETMDAVIEGLIAVKAEGLVRTGRSVRSVIRA